MTPPEAPIANATDPTVRHLARTSLAAFVLTRGAARALVCLILEGTSSSTPAARTSTT